MPTPTEAVPPELAAERAWLEHAKAQVLRMLDVAENTDPAAANWFSHAALLGIMEDRAQELRDTIGATLFFGRIDRQVEEGAAPVSCGTDVPEGRERWYVGRRHIGDENGNPVVIDWRAPVSTAFYRASPTEPMGVTHRRRFGLEAGEITAYEDEWLDRPETLGHSAILAQEIERPRVGPMRDIVATIQPEQDEIVRVDADTSICVQGAPGTGKTAVGLHRAAWLLYSFRERLSRTGVLVIGPNQAFLDHIGAVLPALGEVRVAHSTLAGLLAHAKVRGADPAQVAVLKGDARMAQVLHAAVWAHVAEPTEPLRVTRGAHRWLVGTSEVAEQLRVLRERGVRYDAAREMLAQRLAHRVLVKMEQSGDSPDDRVQDSVARSREVKACVAALWPKLTPAEVLFRLWTDADFLASCADGVLTPDEQGLLLLDPAPATKGSVRWTAADMALLDEVADQFNRTPALGHVVLDEAQDCSPMQLRAVGRRASTTAVTVLGDIAQGTTPWAVSTWAQALEHLGHPDAHVEVLDRGFRVPRSVIEYASTLLPTIAPGLSAPVSVREEPGDLVVRAEASPKAALAGAVDAVQEALASPGSVGLIVAGPRVKAAARALTTAGIEHVVLGETHGDDLEHPHRVQLVPAQVAKGLEFDRVVVLEPADIAADEPDERTGLRRLYVVLTRAVSGLTVVHAQPLPGALAAA